jgi:hypothetical protein
MKINFIKANSSLLSFTLGILSIFTLAPATWVAPAIGLEVIRDSGVTPEFPGRPEILLDDDPKRVTGPAACATPIRPDLETWLEENKLMVRLPAPFQKNGQSFEWRIGNKDGTTYWHRMPLDDGRSEISMYVPTEGLQFKIVAAFMTIYWSKGEVITIDPEEYKQYGEALLSTMDLQMTFADKLNQEQLTTYYMSKLMRNVGQGNWRAVLDDSNRNIWIRYFMKAKVQC